MGLTASICPDCERAVIPSREICPYCGISAGRQRTIEISPEGTVLSYSVLEMPPAGFEPPVLIALIALEHDATVLCIGDRADIDTIEIDSRVIVYVGDDGKFHFQLR